MKAVHGEAVEVKKYRSLGVARLIVELPIESYRDTVDLLDDRRVLVTLAPDGFDAVPYGLVDEEPESEGQAPKALPAPKGKNHTLASQMMIAGYFRNPKLWEAMETARIYTQDDHKAHIAGLPCMAKSAPDLFWEHAGAKRTPCSGDVVAHHCNTAANSGMGKKAKDYYTVPLCCAHHIPVVHDHQRRELDQWLLGIAVEATAGQMRQAMKMAMGRESFTGLTKKELNEFEVRIGFSGMVGVS